MKVALSLSLSPSGRSFIFAGSGWRGDGRPRTGLVGGGLGMCSPLSFLCAEQGLHNSGRYVNSEGTNNDYASVKSRSHKNSYGNRVMEKERGGPVPLRFNPERNNPVDFLGVVKPCGHRERGTLFSFLFFRVGGWGIVYLLPCYQLFPAWAP